MLIVFLLFVSLSLLLSFYFFFFIDTPTPEIYTLSLHDALPISLMSLFITTMFVMVVLGGFVKIIGVNKDRKSTRLNSSHVAISYAVFCLKKKKRHADVDVWKLTRDPLTLTEACIDVFYHYHHFS